MQLTIDSAEPLEHVLRVVGSLYGTELAVAPDATIPEAAQPPTKSARRRKRGATTSASRKRTRAGSPSTADIRAWAQGHGYEVASRGRVRTTSCAHTPTRAAGSRAALPIAGTSP